MVASALELIQSRLLLRKALVLRLQRAHILILDTHLLIGMTDPPITTRETPIR